LTARQLSNLPEFPKSEGENRHLATLVAAEREREREEGEGRPKPVGLVGKATAERRATAANRRYSVFSSLFFSSPQLTQSVI
jgi:hypothetical protein